MKKLFFLSSLIMLIFSGCDKKQEQFNENSSAVLNGTWNYLFADVSEAEITEIIHDMYSDPDKQRDFSWGKGVFNVNGSWYFDISKKYANFYPDGGPLYTIVSYSKNMEDNIVLEIIANETSKNLLSQGKTIEGNTIKLIVSIEDENRILLKNAEVLNYIRPIMLYRLSGPNMKIE